TLVDELNARQMRGFGSSRAELFAELDKPKLTRGRNKSCSSRHAKIERSANTRERSVEEPAGRLHPCG
ncbi:hypothetical protein, partial [Bradyrhizobium elkanii]